MSAATAPGDQNAHIEAMKERVTARTKEAEQLFRPNAATTAGDAGVLAQAAEREDQQARTEEEKLALAVAAAKARAATTVGTEQTDQATDAADVK